MRLLLESTLALDGQFGSHLVGWGWAEDVLLSRDRVGVQGSNPNSQPPEYFANPNVALKRKTVCMRRKGATTKSWQSARATGRPCGGCNSFAVARPIYLLEGVRPIKPR